MSARRRSCDRSGVVLICALVCLSVATALVITTTRHALDARRQGRMERQLRQTEYLLDAGIRRAVAQLRSRGDYEGESWQPSGALLGLKTVLVEVRVSESAAASSDRQVTVVARLGQSDALAFRTQRSHTFTYSLHDPAEPSSPE